MISDDIVTWIHTNLPDIQNVFTEIRWQSVQPVHGVVVQQRQTSTVPYTLLDSDTVFLDILVRGAGTGEMGRTAGYATAMKLYRAFLIVYQCEAGDSHIVRITADSAPFESNDGNGDWWWQFGIQVTRYLGN